MKQTARKAFVAVLILLAASLVCGCTISSGVFIGMSNSSTDTSLSASYIKFDGSLGRQVSLNKGSEVTFSIEGGEGLSAAVKKDGKNVFGIADGETFTVPASGTYIFVLEGSAGNGSFSLSWRVE